MGGLERVGVGGFVEATSLAMEVDLDAEHRGSRAEEDYSQGGAQRDEFHEMSGRIAAQGCM